MDLSISGQSRDAEGRHRAAHSGLGPWVGSGRVPAWPDPPPKSLQSTPVDGQRAIGIDPTRLGSRGIGIHSLRKTAINGAIRNGATMHEVREFAGHADIRTTEVYFVRKEEDAEVAARRIQIRVTGRTGA